MAILDAYGNEVKLPAKPQKGYGISYRVSSREYDYSTRDLTPAGLWGAAVAADSGDTSALQTYFEKAFRHDSKLYNLDQRRRNAIAGLDWEWRPYREDTEEPDSSDVENCELIADVVERIPKIQDNVKGILSAIGCGFAVWDINWVDVNGVLVPYLRSIPQRLFTWQDQDADQLVTTDWPNVLTEEDTTYGTPLKPEKAIVAIYQDAVEPWHCGVMQSCIWYWLRKRQLWSQVMSTGERFAEPIPVGYYGVDEQNARIENEVMDAQEAYGPGGVIALPGTGAPLTQDKDGRFRGAYLDLKQPDLRVPQGFWSANIEACDREMSIAWTSGNLLTDTTGGTGTYSALEGQAKSEVKDIRQHDADWLAMGPMRDLARMILLFNKGPDAAQRVPILDFPGLAPAADLVQKSTVYEIIGRTNWDAVRGLPREIREEFEIPEMEEQEPEEKPEVEEGPTLEPEPTEPPDEGPYDDLDQINDIMTSDRLAAAIIKDPGIEAIMKDVAKLAAKSDPFNEAAAEGVRDRVTAYLLRMKNPPKSPKAFQNAVLKHIDANYAELADELDNAGMTDWFESTYKKYKTQDRSIWHGKTPPQMAVSFGTKDVRAAKHMADQAYWHFSKFTDNDTFRKPIQDFLAKTYMEDGAQLFVRNEKVVKAFAQKLGDTTKELASHEVDRIARTSVARAREQARIMQMADAGVKKAVVSVHPDACPICRAYAGKTVDVAAEVVWMEHLEMLSGEDYHEALKEHSKQAIKGVPPHEFDLSGGGPLYHPNCRCGVDME